MLSFYIHFRGGAWFPKLVARFSLFLFVPFWENPKSFHIARKWMPQEEKKESGGTKFNGSCRQKWRQIYTPRAVKSERTNEIWLTKLTKALENAANWGGRVGRKGWWRRVVWEQRHSLLPQMAKLSPPGGMFCVCWLEFPPIKPRGKQLFATFRL